MKSSEITKILINEISSLQSYDQETTLEMIRYFLDFKYERFSLYQIEIEEIEKKMAKKLLPHSAIEVSNLYWDQSLRLNFYAKIFKFFFYVKYNDNSPANLKHIETKMKLDRLETHDIREKVFDEYYTKDLSLKSVTKSVASFMSVVVSNDGRVDKKEWESFKFLLAKINLSYSLPIKNFNLSTVLKFSTISPELRLEYKKLLFAAAASDGFFRRSEHNFLMKIFQKLEIPGNHGKISNELLSVLSLSILLSDGELSPKEEKWFFENFKVKNLNYSINDAFLLLVVTSFRSDVFFKRSSFFEKIFSHSLKSFNIASRLFLVYAKNYLKLDSSICQNYSQVLAKMTNSADFHSFSMKVISEVITKEDLMLFMNVAFNDYHTLSKINKMISKEYVEKIYFSLETYNSKLEYYFLCSALFSDYKVSGSEYEVMWKKFASMKVNVNDFLQAINHYSLLIQKKISFDNYYTYLNDLSA